MEVYAELFFDENKNAFLDKLPENIVLNRKDKSRFCLFECDTKNDMEQLIEFLDRHLVCYQKLD